MKKLIFLGLLFFSLIWLYRFYTASINYALDPDSDNRVSVTIAKGSSADAIATQLYDEGLINSPAAFKLYIKTNELSGDLKAGKMIMRENFTMKDIVDTLVKGGSNEDVVTLLEGWTNRQIADYLETIGLTTADAFYECTQTCSFDYDFLPDDSLEGYLYPDTYFVDPAAYSDEAFINRLISTLESKLDSDDWLAIEESGYTFQQIMIMASIVEREERSESERPTIAGILWDRFDNGVGLGADATVLYALNRTKGGLSYNDLQIDSPYNTRKYRGLPPTPISNPSISSIRAALYPKRTDYFYYLHGSDGQVHYAVSLDEHNENKRRFLN